MAKKNKGYRKFLWIALAVLVLGGIGYFSLGFTLTGNYQTKSFCEQVMKDQWCTEGYHCSACALTTLPYNLQFSDGTVTNKVYQADCTLSAKSPDACTTDSMITSHAYTQCYSGNVYYYNSVGTREDKKSTCSNGCTQVSLTYAKCNDAPVTTPTGQKVCMPGTNYLCTNAILSGGNYYCDIEDKTYCSYGCENGACKPQSCKNDCDTNGYIECSSTTTFKQCSVGADNCLHWDDGFSCSSNQVCSNGRCIAKTEATPTPEPTPDCTDYGKSKCITQYSYQSCSNTGTLSSIIACDDGYKCDQGSCIKVAQQNVTQPGTTNPCAGVDTGDRCLGTTFQSGGTCNNGVVTYAHLAYNSENCLSTNSTNDNSIIDNNKSDPLAELFNFEKGTGYWSVGIIAFAILIIALLIIEYKNKR